jgi:hypothetical protein
LSQFLAAYTVMLAALLSSMNFVFALEGYRTELLIFVLAVAFHKLIFGLPRVLRPVKVKEVDEKTTLAEDGCHHDGRSAFSREALLMARAAAMDKAGRKQEKASCNNKNDVFCREDMLLARTAVLRRRPKGNLPEFCSFLVPKAVSIRGEGMAVDVGFLPYLTTQDGFVDMSQEKPAPSELWAKWQEMQQQKNESRTRNGDDSGSWSQWSSKSDHAYPKHHDWRFEDRYSSAQWWNKEHGQSTWKEWAQEEANAAETCFGKACDEMDAALREGSESSCLSTDAGVEGGRGDVSSCIASMEEAAREADTLEAQSQQKKPDFVPRWRASRALQRRDDHPLSPVSDDGDKDSVSLEGCTKVCGRNGDSAGSHKVPSQVRRNQGGRK